MGKFVFSMTAKPRMGKYNCTGTGKIPYSAFKVQLDFPIQGLTVVVKKNCPIRGYATHGAIFLHYSCLAFHGEV